METADITINVEVDEAINKIRELRQEIVRLDTEARVARDAVEKLIEAKAAWVKDMESEEE